MANPHSLVKHKSFCLDSTTSHLSQTPHPTSSHPPHTCTYAHKLVPYIYDYEFVIHFIGHIVGKNASLPTYSFEWVSSFVASSLSFVFESSSRQHQYHSGDEDGDSEYEHRDDNMRGSQYNKDSLHSHHTRLHRFGHQGNEYGQDGYSNRRSSGSGVDGIKTNSFSNAFTKSQTQSVFLNSNAALNTHRMRATFTESLLLQINNLIGPGMLALPIMYQQAGWFLSTVLLLFFFVLSSLAATMLCESIAILRQLRLVMWRKMEDQGYFKK